ncbi:MAG: medium chain dehydrogenase/reductase family protein, partial [Chloroflexi bacterium]|nr:medium chain dehydrogenase/reductase family protein [Chloroflexota bacterium]
MMIVTEMVLPSVGEPETLELRKRELAPLGAGQVLIRVEATGVSFAEQSMRRGRYPGQPTFPFVPGYDIVGVVTDLGAGVTEVTLGQRVAAVTKIGGWADYIVLPAIDLVPVPDGLEAVDAETAGVNGVTAWQMLHDLAKVRAGQTILVHGATGGVGVLLVQLARLAGARVIGTASPAKHDKVRALGAEPLDYHGADLVARVRALVPGGVDAVFDHVGGQSLYDSWQLLAPGGTLVSYGIASKRDTQDSMLLVFIPHLARLYWWNALPNGRHAYFYNVWGGKTLRPRAFRQELHAALGAVLALLAQGRIQAQVARRVPLEQAAEGLRLAESGTVTGKV